MKGSEFKKILKPLIKQTVKEVLLEEGMLAKIVSEVAQGLSGREVIAESTKKQENDKQLEERAFLLEQQRQERIKKLNESSNLGNIFSNTKPISSKTTHGPLASVSSNDSGVDISSIERLANGKWKQLI